MQNNLDSLLKELGQEIEDIDSYNQELALSENLLKQLDEIDFEEGDNLEQLINELDQEIDEIDNYNQELSLSEELLKQLDGIIENQEAPEFRATIHQVIKWQGLDIGLEYKPGDIRFRGTGYERKLRHGYGHIRNYKGADGEALDCYLAPTFFNDSEPTNLIFEISQLSPEDGDFDEHKFILGFESQEQAKSAYLQEMSEAHFGGIKEVGIEDLEQYRKSKPDFEEPEIVQVDGTVLSENEYESIASVDERDIAAALSNWKKVAPDEYANLLGAGEE